MEKILNFRVLTMDCPLQQWLIYNEIVGVDQTHELVSNELIAYMVNKLNGITVPFAFSPDTMRVLADGQLDLNMTEFLRQNTIENLAEKSVILAPTIKGHVCVCTLNNAPAIIKISRSKQFRNLLDTAAELVQAANIIYGGTLPTDLQIGIISPLTNTIRMFPKEGKLTAKGVPDKTDPVGKWENAIKHFNDLTTTIEKLKDQNVPQPKFGECLFCSYHNVKLTLPNGTEVQCRG